VSRRAAILAASLTLQHVPDLVRYGSKPSREQARIPEVVAALRTFEDAVAYLPHQVFIGNRRPECLREFARPWAASSTAGTAAGRSGEIMSQAAFYELMAEVDQFGLLRLKEQPGAADLTIYADGEVAGAFSAAHDADESLSAQVLLENLACKAGAVHATRFMLARHGVDPDSVSFVLGSGEEAIGDRYQRGGGNLGKAVAEATGLRQAAGADVKAFCAGPVHALVMAGALVEAGVHDRVAVVAGGSLAKLGMKFESALDRGTPILEDVLAGLAVLVGPAGEPGGLVMRLDAVGRHRVAAGSSQQALLEDIVGWPLTRMGRTITDIGIYAPELHNPEITQPAGGGDVPDRNYRMLAGYGVLRGDLAKADMPGFAAQHGIPGFSPTQGHIASAIPWLPHALDRAAQGELSSTMLMAKGSLFLGRMTRLWDGASLTLEV
jgi:hypothetical protein